MSYEVVKLKYLSQVPITNGLGLPGEHDNPEWPRYIRTTDIASPTSLRDDVFASQPPDVASKARVSSGDILMTAVGATIGKSVRLTGVGDACYAGFLVRYRPINRVDGRFVAYWMQSQHYWDQISVGAVRSTIDNFSASKYREMQVPLPPVEEQRRIADFLDDQVVSLDRAISSTVAQESLLGEGLSGHVSAEVDRLADEFGEVPLRRYVHGIEQGWSPECSSEPAGADEDGVLKLGAVGPGHFRSEENKAMLPGVRPDPRYALSKGDLLITRANTRDLVGQCAVVPADFPRLYLCDLVYRVHVSKLEPEFVVVAMQSGRVRGLLATTARGTSGTMVKLRGDDIREIPIPAAPIGARLAAVRSFAEHQAHFEEGTLALTRRRELLAERKRSLITKAVTGELDVTTAKPIGTGRWLPSVTAKAGPAATTSLNIGGA